MNDESSRVEQFLIDIQSVSPHWLAIAQVVRDMYAKHASNIAEGIKYGGLVFYLQNELVGGVFFYKNHASLEISNGAQLADPYKVLEGTGQNRRHIKLRNKNDAISKQLEHYVQSSLAAIV